MSIDARLRRTARRARRAVHRALGLGLGRRRRADLQQRLAKVRAQRDTARANLARARSGRAALAQRVDELAAEVEAVRADAAVAGGRDRSDLSYLFVVTYGRSGSTLLQGVLSATPGVMIRGENGGVLARLFEFHDTLRHHQQRLARTEPLPASHPWWGVDGYPAATALREIRQLMLDTVLRPARDTRVVGFKEIDWPGEGLAEFLEFVRAVFPGARFVLNTRDLAHVAASKWWAARPDAAAELAAMEHRYVEALDSLGAATSYRVHYDDYVADPAVLRGLFEWLGEEFDEERVRAVMSVRHSY